MDDTTDAPRPRFVAVKHYGSWTVKFGKAVVGYFASEADAIRGAEELSRAYPMGYKTR